MAVGSRPDLTNSPHAAPLPSAATAEAIGSARAGWRAYLELTKPGLTGLVVATSSFGYLLARPSPLNWGLLLSASIGTALLAGGASGFNQWVETIPDSQMNRTKRRPFPSNRLAPRSGFVFAAALSAAGFAVLAAGANALTAFLGLFSWAIYLFAYTPLKRRTTMNTIVGAICGAIPPVLGWTAATNEFGAGALVLFAILFVWQIPHFLSIAWIYREDYERGGFRMLPIADPAGHTTFRIALYYSFGLIPVTLSAAAIGLSGWVYALGAMAGGLFLVAAALRLERERTQEAARALFFLTIAYLPAILLLMILDPTRLPTHLG